MLANNSNKMVWVGVATGLVGLLGASTMVLFPSAMSSVRDDVFGLTTRFADVVSVDNSSGNVSTVKATINYGIDDSGGFQYGEKTSSLIGMLNDGVYGPASEVSVDGKAVTTNASSYQLETSSDKYSAIASDFQVTGSTLSAADLKEFEIFDDGDFANWTNTQNLQSFLSANIKNQVEKGNSDFTINLNLRFESSTKSGTYLIVPVELHVTKNQSSISE